MSVVTADHSADFHFPASLEMRHRTEHARAVAREARHHHVDEAARLALLDKLRHQQLSESDIRHRLARIREVAESGEYQLLLERFPSDLCTDRGRAINNFEDGWYQTLVGPPRQIYAYWEENLVRLGYGITAYIVDFPEGIPGDAGLFLTW